MKAISLSAKPLKLVSGTGTCVPVDATEDTMTNGTKRDANRVPDSGLNSAELTDSLKGAVSWGNYDGECPNLDP